MSTHTRTAKIHPGKMADCPRCKVQERGLDATFEELYRQDPKIRERAKSQQKERER